MLTSNRTKPEESDDIIWTLDCVPGSATADQPTARKYSLLKQFLFTLQPKVEAPQSHLMELVSHSEMVEGPLWLRNKAPQSQSNPNEKETGRDPHTHVDGPKSAHKQNYERNEIGLTFFTVSK